MHTRVFFKAMQKAFILLSIIIGYSITTSAQIKYYNANAFPLLGKATSHTYTRYDRLADSLRFLVRTPLYNLGSNTAGLSIRFRSNSSQIALKWKCRFNNHMNHMTDTGIKGLDLYTLMPNHMWRFVGSARPTGKINKATVIQHMEPKMREYMLYLSLYDGIDTLQIGIDSLATLLQPTIDSPHRNHPIVFYGTSILQGGCASRPGMAHTNIIQRRLNLECINLGFSGNGLLDLEVARIMAEVEASVFVLDFVPNASIEHMQERMIPFYRIIRERHPHTPILFIEDPIFTHAQFDVTIEKEIRNKNGMLHTLFNKLKSQGEKEIYLLSSKKMIGNDGEATVDGIHFTDLGMMRYADMLTPVLKKLVKRGLKR